MEFTVLMDQADQGLKDDYFPLYVCRLSNRARGALFIPVKANDTLATIVCQGWGSKIGLKLKFSRSTPSRPGQEDIAAVLDQMLTLNMHQKRPLRVVVIELDLHDINLEDFATFKTLYGSKLELIPGLSGGELAHVVRSLEGDADYNHYVCRERHIRKCSDLVTVYDRTDTPLYRRSVREPIPKCHIATVSPRMCIACQNGDVKLICPESLEPQDFESSKGERLDLHLDTPQRWRSGEQKRAHAILGVVSQLVASHRAFLSLDTLSVFPRNHTGCDSVPPGRWGVGKYAPEDPYAKMIPRDERCPERTGLLLFEELSQISNS